MIMYVEVEDSDIVYDLREVQSGRKSKFDVLGDECQIFLQEDVELAVNERRHSQFTHILRAISVWDLLHSFLHDFGLTCSSGRRVHLYILVSTVLGVFQQNTWYRLGSFIKNTKMHMLCSNNYSNIAFPFAWTINIV